MLTNSQLLLLDNLIYLNEVVNHNTDTVGEIVDRLLNQGGLDSSINPDKIGTVDEFPGRMTRAEWVEILEFIEADTELCSYTLTNGVGEDSDGLRAACFVNGNDVNVVFRATGGDDEWHDNGQGGYLSDTQCQIEALDYFNGLPYYTSADITATGHSKGGANAMYAAVAAA
ncbi:MAG: DUF2974 domain-containing protein [Parabacteroides sp.]|nr:DUF2974 domain-containing protein [Parabacteroides sp.]